MCMEDIKIGRQASTRPVFWSRLAGAGSNVMGANLGRIRVIISHDGLSQIQVYFAASIDGQPLIVLGTGTTLAVLRVEDIGSIITQPIFINNPGAATVTGSVTEVIYKEEDGPKYGISQPPEFRQVTASNGGELQRAESGPRQARKSPFGSR